MMNDGSSRNNREDMVILFQALGHSTRLAIVDSLKDGKKCVTDVCELLKVQQPNLSQHLAILRREKIVKVTAEGSKRCYELTNPKQIRALLDIFSSGYKSQE